MTVLVLTGSARQDSHTRRLGEQLVAAIPGGVLAPRLTELPFFDQDLEATPPVAVSALRQQVESAQAIVVVTPEYNGTVPGLLGNAIDWLSRPYGGRPAVLRGKPAIAVAASPGGVGAVRALVSLRTVLGNAGVELLEATLSVPEVHLRLENGSLAAELAVLAASFSQEPAAAA